MIVYLLVLVLSFLGWIHEYPRYKQCLDECTQQYKQDVELLNRDVCANPYDRVMFTNTVDCKGAETRLQTYPKQCARMKWWKASYIAVVFGDYWVILPVILVFIYVYFGSSSKKKHHKKPHYVEVKRITQ